MPGDEGRVLYLWEQVTAAAPEEDRLGWLAEHTGLPFRELDWARRMRNRIAHPDGGLLDPDDISRAAEILSDAYVLLDGDPYDYDDAPAPVAGGFLHGRLGARLLSKADPVFDRLEPVRGALRVAVPIVVGVAVLWIAVSAVGGVGALDQPLTYLWLFLVLALIALAVVFLPELLGLLLVGGAVYGLVSGNWMGFLQICLTTVVVGAVGGLLSWLYDLS